VNTWHIELAGPESATSRESYVGLVRDTLTGRHTLRLPIGYALPPDPSPHEHLGRITRAIAHFCTLFADRKIADSPRDGLLGGSNGERLTPGDAPAPGFSRMRACLALIRRLRNPHFLAEVRKPGLNSQFNDRQISRALEHAHFLPDGTPVFEQMWGSSRQLGVKHEDYSGLAVWIALDALGHLFPDDMDTALSPGLRAECAAIAAQFANAYRLSPDASLYAGKSDRTLATLRAALARMSTQAPAVFAATRELQHLLDVYLNHEMNGPGDIRGVAGFYQVWEAACLQHARARYGDDRIHTCDPQFAGPATPATLRRWQDNRERVFARNGRDRRPDLVLLNENGRHTLIDFKYSMAFGRDAAFYSRRPAVPDLKSLKPTRDSIEEFKEALKLAQDVNNAEAYRWLYMQHQLETHQDDAVDIEFWVPAFEAEAMPVAWSVHGIGSRHAGSGFRGFSVRHQPTATLLSDFAAKFRLL
jgi:hypothetical protein